MSDMGWSRYIAAQDAAAELEMAADEQVAKVIADEGVRGLLERATKELGATEPFAQKELDVIQRLAEVLWAAAGEYCIRHADKRDWHPLTDYPLCPAGRDNPRPTYDV